jgi:hypothetical protein
VLEMSSTTDDSTDTDSPNSTQAQMYSFPGDNGVDLKRAYEELLAKNKIYEEAEQKRKRRKSKVGIKGDDFKNLDGIKTEARLNESQECALGQMARIKVWPDMKYYVRAYKDDLLKMAYKALGMETKPDRGRYADHILYFTNKKLTNHTHNCVGYIKRKVCGEDDFGGKLG